MRRCLLFAGIASTALGLSHGSAVAQAPQVFMCAVEQAIACVPFEPCERSLPGAVNLPALMKVDRAAKLVLSRHDNGVERVSPIVTDTGDDASVVLQGVDAGNPWSLRVAVETGRMALASAHEETAFLAFGLCSASILD